MDKTRLEEKKDPLRTKNAPGTPHWHGFWKFGQMSKHHCWIVYQKAPLFYNNCHRSFTILNLLGKCNNQSIHHEWKENVADFLYNFRIIFRKFRDPKAFWGLVNNFERSIKRTSRGGRVRGLGQIHIDPLQFTNPLYSDIYIRHKSCRRF